MKRIIIFFSFVLLVFIIFVPSILASESKGEEIKVVVAEGNAPIYENDTLKAKEAALGLAKRNAVESAIGSLVTAQTIVENFQTISDKIFVKTSGYIKKYKVISEEKEGGLYKLKIEAEVTIENIKDDLIALNLLQEAMQKPRIMVIIKEKNMGQNSSSPIAEKIILDKFIQKDFNIVDPLQVRNIRKDTKAQLALDGNLDAAAALGTQLGAEVIVIGEAQAQSSPIGIEGVNMVTCQAVISVKAIRASTGKTLVAKNTDAKVAHISELTGGKKALEDAANKVSETLIEDIVKIWNDEVMNAALIQVNVFNVNYDNFSKLIARLKKTQGVLSVYEREFTDIVGEMDVNFIGNVQQLTGRLLELKFKDFKLKIQKVQSHRIDLKAEKLKMTE